MKLGWTLSFALLAACSFASPAPIDVRVVTWNIHHGRGLDGRVDLDRIADELRVLDADLVLLQEVDVGCRRSGGVDTPKSLANRLGMHAAFAENIAFQGGSYGNAILSRWPIVQQANVHYRMLRDGEQRGLLTVEVRSPAGPLAIGCTHIDYRPDDSERLANTVEILAAVDRERLLAVGGDFNDLPASPVHAALCGPLVDCWDEANGSLGDHASGGESYPATTPHKRIDWLLRSAGWQTRSARVVPTAASDHRPVVFELRR